MLDTGLGDLGAGVCIIDGLHSERRALLTAQDFKGESSSIEMVHARMLQIQICPSDDFQIIQVDTGSFELPNTKFKFMT